MTKRILAMLLCAVLVLSLAACEKRKGPRKPPVTVESPSGSQQTIPPTAAPAETEPAETEPGDQEPEETPPSEEEPTESEPAESEPGDQDPAETPPSEEEPTESKPGDNDPSDTDPSDTDPGENEPASFLAQLELEYITGKGIEGVSQDHVYQIRPSERDAFTTENCVFDYTDTFGKYIWAVYNVDTKTKSMVDLSAYSDDSLLFYLDGYFYFLTEDCARIIKTDESGEVGSYTPSDGSAIDDLYFYGNGFVCVTGNGCTVLSMDLEEKDRVGYPEEDGMDVFHCFDGYLYAGSFSTNIYYRLNPDAGTLEWTNMGKIEATKDCIFARLGGGKPFCGRFRYNTSAENIYDMKTGDTVFEPGDLYAPAVENGNIYFGGVLYIGYDEWDEQYRWVNLLEKTMSDPFKLPEDCDWVYFVTINTCVFKDSEGVFLCNFNSETGEASAIATE